VLLLLDFQFDGSADIHSSTEKRFANGSEDDFTAEKRHSFSKKMIGFDRAAKKHFSLF
jgi:hypothetical protein